MLIARLKRLPGDVEKPAWRVVHGAGQHPREGQHHGEQLDALSATFSNGSIDLRYFSSEQHVEEHAEHNGEHGASQRRREKREKKKKKKQNHPEEDDVAVLRPASILERAEKALLEKYSDEACFIQAGLQIIQIRVYNSGCNPKTPAYYVESYENLKESEKDWQVVEWHAQNPTSSDRLNRVNVLILRAEKESKKTGRDVITCFHDLRQDPHCYDSVAIP
jgi:hypothetical protein